MSLERICYTDVGLRPFLYYAVFGYAVFGGDGENLRISRSRHRVTGFPDGLELRRFDRQNHANFLDSLLGDPMGRLLRQDSPEAYQKALASQSCMVLAGTVQQDQSLDYLQNAVGIVQALVETGAEAVLDPQTLRLYSAQEWEARLFRPELDPYRHTVILVSEQADGALWLHTRGMRKFGRPDISLTDVEQAAQATAAQLVNQMIWYSAQGAFFQQAIRLHLQEGAAAVLRPAYVDDPETPDFNNGYYRLSWPEIQWE